MKKSYSVNIIDDKMISDVLNTTIVNIPKGAISENVKTIPIRAFQECKYLESIFLPGSIIEIKTLAFYNCTSLRNIIFGGTIEQWNAVIKADKWLENSPAEFIQCLDGQVSL